MKKWILITAAVMFAAGLALGGAYITLAQGNNPPAPFNGPSSWMRGWMHSEAYTGTMPYGRGGMMGRDDTRREDAWGNGQAYTGTMPFGRGGAQGAPLYGTMMLPGGVHEQVWTAVAKELGLTYDQLQKELATKTLTQLAQEKNVAIERLQNVYKAAHKTALDELVADGKLTREQADAMIQRMEAAGWPMLDGQGRGFGPCHDLDDDDNTGTPGFGPRGGMGGRGRMMTPFSGGRQG
jgi:hypothetical protein